MSGGTPPSSGGGDATEKVVDRIRRLLRLSTSSNPNEAAVAAALAQELMARHRIESARLLPAGEAENIRDHRDAPLEASKRLRPWKIELAGVVARANGCRIYLLERGKESEVILVGRTEDAELVRVLFAELVVRVESATRSGTEGRDRAFCNAFRLGAVTTIEERLRLANAEARNAALASGAGDAPASAQSKASFVDEPMVYALARLDARADAVDRFMEETLRLTRGKSRNLRADAEGFAYGRVAGHALPLAPSAPAGPSKKSTVKATRGGR